MYFTVTGAAGVGGGAAVGGVTGAEYAAYTSPYTQYSPAAAAYSAYGYGSGGIISKYSISMMHNRHFSAQTTVSFFHVMLEICVIEGGGGNMLRKLR